MSELVNLCFSLDEDSLCLSDSFFSGLLLSSDLFCHWLFITCCRRRPTHTSEGQRGWFYGAELDQQARWSEERGSCHRSAQVYRFTAAEEIHKETRQSAP